MAALWLLRVIQHFGIIATTAVAVGTTTTLYNIRATTTTATTAAATTAAAIGAAFDGAAAVTYGTTHLQQGVAEHEAAAIDAITTTATTTTHMTRDAARACMSVSDTCH